MPNPALKIVGLTGGIGSGKSTAAKVFESLGIVVADTDQIARAITAENGEAIPKIKQHFGDTFISNGALNRDAMRKAVFENPAIKKELEEILHPIIEKKSWFTVENADSPYVILDVPLLFESPAFLKRCARVLVIDCPESLQIKRVLARNRWDEKTIRAIIKAQTPRTIRIKKADDIIENTGDLTELKSQIQKIHTFYLKLFKKTA